MNPYKSPECSERDSGGRQEKEIFNNHQFAGIWLLISGAVHFMVFNVFWGIRSLDTVEWASPSLFVILGLFVWGRFGLAVALTRIGGAISILVAIMSPLFILFGSGPGSAISYGRITIIDPEPWQVCLFAIIILATTLPPCLALKPGISDNNVFHRSRGFGRI